MVAIVIFYIGILASRILTTLAILLVVFRAVEFCILALLWWVISLWRFVL